MSDIWQRGNEIPLWPQERTQRPERLQRVLQVLQHVGCKDHVEAVVTQLLLEIQRVEVPNDYPLAEALGREAICASISTATTVHPRSRRISDM